ncbi:RHS repeat-associated core domain-containing protein [Mitsuaria sp. WAJ17]|uniref:RHS repeat-associated core domain-containing protein n=1 Tax=Mitsuaria sp. WAJ17 TaxID=2761452 RepID=UPI001601FBD9|nr:RHS repeat-associated core domain-containing protein [Mitsuaria sp. WAJ17]MBB2488167.1 RHS repeat-associated core domain-containing protein [Mitsuaria sp. WAJ17]
MHTDALGSPVAHTGPTGALLNRTRYEPYGYVAAGTKPGPATSLMGYTGHVQDPETELVYMQQRYYDPVAGRFLSVDPIVTDANTGKQFGRYVYVENNPYRYVDPDGMDKRDEQIAEQNKRERDRFCGVIGCEGDSKVAYPEEKSSPVNGGTIIRTRDGGFLTVNQAQASGTAAAAILAPGIVLELLGGANLTATEIIAINRSFGGVAELTGSAETVIANMAYRETLMGKAASAIRDIAGRHLFNDANKRTAQAVAERLLGRKIDPAKIRAAIDRVANGEVRSVEDTSKLLGR